ncbi:MAG TPA: glutamyl-tRNA reductase [Smithella sp.]|mgnify:FL=1|jgi:glutamyl-tRNA reductase|nr:glutamyl-tRNA reductase [Smithella sp.]NMC98023.1 glutamyl-tRNA reductase [Deltaproteobacteria bacterium]OQC53897.1 MAG: Glutamyl-tRNA reductase [Deltaproteobacteria bacterium ADurb.Bin022]HNQ64708.1 glutamyl-tRNA reductase [Smithella sp.]HOE32728.1 glutamyl-tRNA reductase [Smithella sp.]
MIVLTGLNHKTAPLAVREKIFAGCQEKKDLLPALRSIGGVEEVLYLSTCNRVEILASVAEDGNALKELSGFLARNGGLNQAEAANSFYEYRGEDAVRHIFRVASSLDSMVMGEAQILGQVKDAYREALAEYATGVVINRLMHCSFRAAKRVRSETGIAVNPVSVSHAAVELAKKIFGTLTGKIILLIGAGEMAELTGTQLIEKGAQSIIVANRSLAQAELLAEKFHGEAVALDALEKKLIEADIVISSTGAPDFIVTADMLKKIHHRRKNRLLFLIDIAVPRDIDPDASELENVYLYNIDNLQDIVDENINARRKEAIKAEKIIDEELERFINWQKELESVPTIVSLRNKADDIVKAEIEKASGWMNDLKKEDQEKIEILINSIVNKVLHSPVSVMKEESSEFNSRDIVAAVRRLFRLD